MGIKCVGIGLLVKIAQFPQTAEVCPSDEPLEGAQEDLRGYFIKYMFAEPMTGGQGGMGEGTLTAHADADHHFFGLRK